MFTKGQAKPAGSGRKPGSIAGDRRTAREICQANNVDPVQFLCSMIRRRRVPIDLKIDAAKALLKFIHPALSTQHVHADISTQVSTRSVILAAMADPAAVEAMEFLALKLAVASDDAPSAGPAIEATAQPLQIAAPATRDPEPTS